MHSAENWQYSRITGWVAMETQGQHRIRWNNKIIRVADVEQADARQG